MGVFSTSDIAYAKSMGINSQSLAKQWERITHGFESIQLKRAAIINDGICRLSKEDEDRYTRLFENEKENYSISKFVPASGAASRMFQPIRDMRDDPDSDLTRYIISKLTSFPFYQRMIEKLSEKESSIEELIESPEKLAHFILEKEGMNYDDCPKGLIPFHADGSTITCAFEQHLAEARAIGNGSVNFTVAGPYLKTISTLLNDEDVDLSVQDPSTHYIAITNGDVSRDNDGNIVLRPSGHGALIKNLNKIDADIVYIKNIDNIQATEKNDSSIHVKKILGGFLIDLKQRIDTFLFQLEEDANPPIEEAKNWIKETFNANIVFKNKNEIIKYLHRPLRIAGMVLNEGKAGGGPFWVNSKNGDQLQIIEGSQINTNDTEQEKILNSSTHFNPVDIACSLVDHKGVKFDLSSFIDEESGFLSKKQVKGKEAIIMERPGLWNGSMANWLTLFVEIPLESFTPVKTVLDLLPKN